MQTSMSNVTSVFTRIQASRQKLEKLQQQRVAGSKAGLSKVARRELFYAVKFHKDFLEVVAPSANPASLLLGISNFLKEVEDNTEE